MLSSSSDKIWERFTQISLDFVCTIDREGIFRYLSESCKTILGYDKEELKDKSYSEFVYSQDLEKTINTTHNVLQGNQTINFENRLVHKNGQLVWFLWSAVWSEVDEMVFCIGKVVTNARENSHKLNITEQRYKSLFNNNPDIIFTEDKDGCITEANQAFLEAFETSMEKLPDFSWSDHLSSNMDSMGRLASEQALLGNSIRFDLEYIEKTGNRKIYDVLKQPVIIDGSIVYIQTIAKDITPIIKSYETIQQQANKLNTIFESITDAFFTLDNNWTLTYANKEMESLLGIDRSIHIGKNIWDIFPSEIGGHSHQQYHQALTSKTTVHFDDYYAPLKLWFSIRAFPSAEGLSVYFNDITEMVRARKELEKLSLVASKTNNGVLILNSQFHIDWVNEGFTTLTEFTLADALGKTPFQLLYNGNADNTVIEPLIEKMAIGEAVSFEIMRKKKSGNDVWLHVQVNPILDEKKQVERYVFVQTDITGQIKSRQELELLSLVASETTNSVIIMDSMGRIEWVNKGFVNLTGYVLDDIKNKIPYQLLKGPETDPETITRITLKLQAKEPLQEEILIYTKTGEKKWIDVSVTPILDEKGNIYKRVGIQTDVTEKVNTKADVAKLANDLYKQNCDLQQFTYMLSHNLRSPVANLLGFANLLTKMPKESAFYEQSLLKLQESAVQLDKVLRDMNTILSIRDNKGNLELQSINLNQVINQVIKSLQDILSESNSTLENELHDTITIKGNKAYLYSIFHNLISNAIKYRSENRPLIISIKNVSSTSNSTIISVSDNGLGFDMTKVKGDIFKLYKRFHNHVTGSGVGLYLTKSHIEAMGGHIQVYSEVDSGTQFLIYLPS